jgi:hypothetical protein
MTLFEFDILICQSNSFRPYGRACTDKKGERRGGIERVLERSRAGSRQRTRKCKILGEQNEESIRRARHASGRATLPPQRRNSIPPGCWCPRGREARQRWSGSRRGRPQARVLRAEAPPSPYKLELCGGCGGAR